METFNFWVSGFEDTYPENSRKVSFGGGYEFASRPKGPPQIQIRVFLRGYQWFVNPDGTLNTVDDNDGRNVYKLMEFYENHELFEKFIYPHPVRGNVVVRFREPLKIPAVPLDGLGVLPDFSVVFLSQP